MSSSSFGSTPSPGTCRLRNPSQVDNLNDDPRMIWQPRGETIAPRLLSSAHVIGARRISSVVRSAPIFLDPFREHLPKSSSGAKIYSAQSNTLTEGSFADRTRPADPI